MMNWLLVGLLVLALIGIGALAMLIDSGVEDRHKQRFVYALFSLFGLIGVVFMMVEDKSAFVYGDWDSGPKAAKKKGKQHYEVTEKSDEGGPDEVEVTTKADPGIKLDDGSGTSNGKSAQTADGRDCPGCPQMIRLSGGPTVIGTLFREAGQGGPLLGPLQEAKLPAFSIGRYEVTVEQFEMFVKAKGYKPANTCRIGNEVREGASFRNPGFEQGPDHPVVCISWYDAAAFADWLTMKTGRKYDLPTELEWEHAARGGGLDSFVTGKQIHGAQAQFRYVGQNKLSTVNVGTYGANKFGLFDVHGNAAEMLRNCWNATDNPVGATSGECSQRTTKGGSWMSTAGHLHLAARAPVGIGQASNTVGFRVVRHRE